MLFAIEEYLDHQASDTWDGKLKGSVKTTPSKAKKPAKKRVTVSEKLQQTIDKLSPEQMAEILLEIGLSDTYYRQKILRKIPVEFDHKDFAKSLKDYREP